jgi:tetratricopeptide (TPR) repeat protein
MDRRSAAIVAVVVGLVVGAGVGHAAAQGSHNEQQARIYFEAGRLHYDQGRFDEAAREFTLAYELSGNPALLYNIFLAHRDATRLEQAVEALEGYLDKVPDQPNRAGLQARLKAMKAKLEAERSGSPAGPAVAADPATPVAPADPLPAPAHGADPEPVDAPPARSGGVPMGAVVTMAAGGALVLGAVITGVMAKSAESDFHEGCPTRTGCDPALESTRDKARRLGLITDVLWITGAVAAVGGLVWLLVGKGASGETREPPPVAFGCGPGGCGVAYERAF